MGGVDLAKQESFHLRSGPQIIKLMIACDSSGHINEETNTKKMNTSEAGIKRRLSGKYDSIEPSDKRQ